MKNNFSLIKNLDKKAKLLNLKAFAKFFVDSFMIGKFESSFKGNGIDFYDLREYFRGDEFKNIYWKASTNNKMYVKNYVETKENTFLIVCGNHRSLNYGTQNFLKKDGLVEFASILLYYGMSANDNLGLLTYDKSGVDKLILPGKGFSYFNRSIDKLYKMDFQDEIPIDVYDEIYSILLNKINQRTIVFFLSDFYNFDFSRKLKIVAKKHDLIAINFLDVSEMIMKKAGLLRFTNGKLNKENNFIINFLRKMFQVYEESVLIDSDDENIRKEYEDINLEREKIKQKNFEKIGIDFFTVLNDRANALEKAIIKFMEKRSKTKVMG